MQENKQFLPGEVLDLGRCACFANELISGEKNRQEARDCLQEIIRELKTERGREAARAIVDLLFLKTTTSSGIEDARALIKQAKWTLEVGA